ncbi:Alba, DNA/RNA-binding protein [Sulfolobus islandicus Y.G.57.14]|jgi:DNA-binding protein Alba|uniref:DNA/RNA-binding protein Alba 2 n=12 Tax=Saccharolobus TaxID=2100760 RepID=ALBA2_SACSH|nr:MULTISPECIES: chromatin protein Alba2 [Sulfolobaceae]P74762.1 RecName: Full=DNA/RNA-binding protein Alba 2 [Saccharolobus shibatae B12]ACP35355.1 Alba, DNA/RNA-binding protein [Sulfolobus islandicus L.S.2.15]ACP38015.1 Alba, DNA/RNA-binding protein [Sulfolobus islandicus M.14.25]ACP45511.1 Alba, DNA/RNA-binding protein [Sulfolobus islandicus Y.G.57.14]ACP48691.1 Alba, DNA/RNA-binding protein [Sulfolobus islandicus Y.N.15.51]ACP55193.1 Alba, DNA/RNA-binding protein [Sulfolobus islandicus M.
MTEKLNEIVVRKTKNVEDHVLDVIVLFNQGIDEVILKGIGREISKAVDVYNSLKDRLGDGIQLVNVQTGSEVRDRRRISYILLRLKRVY